MVATTSATTAPFVWLPNDKNASLPRRIRKRRRRIPANDATCTNTIMPQIYVAVEPKDAASLLLSSSKRSAAVIPTATTSATDSVAATATSIETTPCPGETTRKTPIQSTTTNERSACHADSIHRNNKHQHQHQHNSSITTTTTHHSQNNNNSNNTNTITKRRTTPRNLQRLRLPGPTTLSYRRLHQLFFAPDPPQHLPEYRKAWHLLCDHPRIYSLPDFLSPKEVAHLLQMAHKHRFQRSFVDDDSVTANTSSNSSRSATAVFDDSHRTSSFLALNKQHDKIVAAIEQRAALFLGAGSSTAVLEALQLVRYRPGQFFGLHHDLGVYHADCDTVDLPGRSTLCPRRLVTFFCYLNTIGGGAAATASSTENSDATTTSATSANTNTNASTTTLPQHSGGATHFPKAGHLRVQPLAGRAVVFSNVTATGRPDVRTIHQGETATTVKYGLNIWFCEQMGR